MRAFGAQAISYGAKVFPAAGSFRGPHCRAVSRVTSSFLTRFLQRSATPYKVFRRRIRDLADGVATGDFVSSRP